MKYKSLWLFVAGIAVLLAVYFFLNNEAIAPGEQNPTNNESQSEQTQEQSEQTADPEPRTLQFDYVSSGSYEPVTYTLAQGEDAVIIVSSDLNEEAHFHGYDLFANLAPDTEGRIEFTANRTGRFEIELEHSGQLLGVIEVLPN